MVMDAVDWLGEWGFGGRLYGCEVCDWLFVGRGERLVCPHCGEMGMVALDVVAMHLFLLVCRNCGFLLGCLRRCCGGDWRVCQVGVVGCGGFEGEAFVGTVAGGICADVADGCGGAGVVGGGGGFDYEVVRHRERFEEAGWRTQVLREGRIRWEPRVGRLVRHYANVQSPALESHGVLAERLGWGEVEGVRPYRGRMWGGC